MKHIKSALVMTAATAAAVFAFGSPAMAGDRGDYYDTDAQINNCQAGDGGHGGSGGDGAVLDSLLGLVIGGDGGSGGDGGDAFCVNFGD